MSSNKQKLWSVLANECVCVLMNLWMHERVSCVETLSVVIRAHGFVGSLCINHIVVPGSFLQLSKDRNTSNIRIIAVILSMLKNQNHCQTPLVLLLSSSEIGGFCPIFPPSRTASFVWEFQWEAVHHSREGTAAGGRVQLVSLQETLRKRNVGLDFSKPTLSLVRTSPPF